MSLNSLIKRAISLADQNSTGLLTGVGVVGTISTAVLTGKASFKAAYRIEQEKGRRFAEAAQGTDLSKDEIKETLDLSFRDKFEVVWTEYIPAVGVGSVTVFSIIMANRLASKEAAALAAAYTLSERAFSEYKEKVVEKLGEGKEKTFRDEISQDRLNNNPVKEVIITNNGDMLFMDLLSGRYFESTREKVQQAENAVNYEIVNNMSATLSTFYDNLGLPPNQMSDIMGWNINNRLEVRFSTGMSTDGRPCITIDFTYPIYDFDKLY